MDAWLGFSGAVTGATAALIGLLIVALSINLRLVVGSPHLVSRVVLALVLLVVPLVAVVLQLVPQSSTSYGIELLAVGLIGGAWMARLARPSGRSEHQPVFAWWMDTVLPAAAVGLSTVVGGALLVAGQESGLYALPVLVVAGFLGSLAITWVLMVEILR